MFTQTVFILGVFLWTSAIISGQRVLIESELGNFLGTLEIYAHTKNDIVFVLSDTSSIEAHRFHHVKQFSKLVSQRFSVSDDDSRVAVVTFSTGSQTPVDYIKNSRGKNMCTLLEEIDDIAYSGGGTQTDEAMEAAEDILAVARPDSEKIIVLLTATESDPGHSPVAISNRLKQKGIIIFAVGVDDVNVQEINMVASSPRHIYILAHFDYISKVNIYLVHDEREDYLDLAEDRINCNALCVENWNCCDVHAKCYCGTRTGRYQCVCNPGYQGRGGYRGHCHKCPKGTFKSISRNTECTACPAHLTTEQEGSTNFMNCTCEEGFKKVGHACERIMVH